MYRIVDENGTVVVGDWANADGTVVVGDWAHRFHLMLDGSRPL